MASPILLSIICPCHNEESAISLFFEALEPVLEGITPNYEIICIDDGSTDATLIQLLAAARRNPRISVIELSRNFGKEAALTCGLDHARGDAVIPIDADLQDPPEIIVDLVAKWREGFEVVLAQRIDRRADSLAKRTSANWFYKLHNRISDSPIPENVGDFRLMDRCVVEAIRKLPEQRRFMKGLFAWVGFRTATVSYSRPERVASATKFSTWRLWNLALEGITSFSTMPLRIWMYIGLAVAGSAFFYATFLILRTILFGIDVHGYASLLVSVLFLGGLQLMGLGIIGEYIGRIYQESKGRPVYIVRREHSQSRDNEAAR
ncbi:MAG TPA: glycosyltransferase family 2 protein [Rhodocyclaceae bacterium]|nr:glycosyltransferase family 2 protein [Rhodocyclaceae bacterium]